MLHIVFQEADIDVLQKAIALDESGGLNGEVWQIKDDYAVGPVADIYEAEGFQARRDFWKEALEFSPYEEQIEIVNDKMTVHNLQKRLNAEEDSEEYIKDVWIWMGQNQHDVCGYYWLMSQLKAYQGRIFVLYLNNLPFINEKGQLFYPSVLHQIQPKEFLKAKRLSRVITLSEFELDPDEWKKTCQENAMVRILEGGKKIAGKEVDFYDKSLLGAITGDFQKLPKILQTAFSKFKVNTGDVFLVWRLRKLVEQGVLELQGDWTKGWKEISLKLAGVASSEAAPVEEAAE
ncbi:DUF1835 domain-containing protein [Danxiaibacter flavus]|uniref:DUF1835 domain-containing protein n=1 Tax=Danxiaibacter flavus TaxID=3049108 RepID=A0ABV3ZDH1_9BACT|nr:DUF1835 domain-containing protein [Chitinophagaceae bacterium DXS]